MFSMSSFRRYERNGPIGPGAFSGMNTNGMLLKNGMLRMAVIADLRRCFMISGLPSGTTSESRYVICLESRKKKYQTMNKNVTKNDRCFKKSNKELKRSERRKTIQCYCAPLATQACCNHIFRDIPMHYIRLHPDHQQRSNLFPLVRFHSALVSI